MFVQVPQSRLALIELAEVLLQDQKEVQPHVSRSSLRMIALKAGRAEKRTDSIAILAWIS